VKRVFILMPMMLPRISDQAAVHLLEILEQLLACVRHHYEPQVHRWQRRQRQADLRMRTPATPLFGDEPF
jgi:hypothetical protein